MSPSPSKTSSKWQRGRIPIIPAVPRKFEKATRKSSQGGIHDQSHDHDQDNVWDYHPAPTQSVDDNPGEAGQNLKIEISGALNDADEVDEPIIAPEYGQSATTNVAHDDHHGSGPPSNAVKAQPSEKTGLTLLTSHSAEQASSFQRGDIFDDGPWSEDQNVPNIGPSYETSQTSFSHQNHISPSVQNDLLKDAPPASYGPTDFVQADITYSQTSSGGAEPVSLTDAQVQPAGHPHLAGEIRTPPGACGIEPHPGFGPTSNLSSPHTPLLSNTTDSSHHDDSQGFTTAGSASRSTIVQQPEDIIARGPDYHVGNSHHARPSPAHPDIHHTRQPSDDAPSATYSTLPERGESGLPLGLHILQNFDVGAFADCRVVVMHVANKFSPLRLSLHTLILARSPTLRAYFANGHYSYDFDGLKLMFLPVSDRFSAPFALEFAFKVLYGTAASDFTGPNHQGARFRTKAEYSLTWMMESLAFASAGRLLQLMPVELRGLEIASKIVNWDNIEQALSYALDSVNFGVGSSLLTRTPEHVYSTNDSDSSATATILTPGTSQDSSKSSPEATSLSNAAYASSKGSSHFDLACAEDLLRHCIHYIAEHVSDQWHFDCTAKPLCHVNRLPCTDESKNTQAKARLSKIQFGDLPTEMSTRVSGQDSLISSLVISLPFIPFKALVSLENQAIEEALPGIVREREARRKILLQSHSVSQSEKEAAMQGDWSEVGYTERVDIVEGHPTLARAYTGLLLE